MMLPLTSSMQCLPVTLNYVLISLFFLNSKVVYGKIKVESYDAQSEYVFSGIDVAFLSGNSSLVCYFRAANNCQALDNV